MFGIALRYIFPLAGGAVLGLMAKKTPSPALPTSYGAAGFYDPPYTAPPQSNVGGLNMYQAIKLGLMAFGILVAYKVAKEVVQ